MRRRWLTAVASTLLCISAAAAFLTAGLVAAPSPGRVPQERVRPDRPFVTAERQRVSVPIGGRTLLFVDQWNVARTYKEGTGRPPAWTRQATVQVSRSLGQFEVAFRWLRADQGFTAARWQVSRYPFATGSAPARDQAVAGLVAAGTVIDYNHSYSASFDQHDFTIDFVGVLNRRGRRGAGSGGALGGDVRQPLQPEGGERSRTPNLGATRRPPLPAAAERRDAEGAQASRARSAFARPRSAGLIEAIAQSLPEPDQVFYVRVIPQRADGSFGEPSEAVTVTVHRPRPCPSVSADIVVKPPSARIVWYMRPNFNQTTGSNGRWYVVHGGNEEAKPGQPRNINPESQFLPQGLHEREHAPSPEEKAWWEKVVDTFKSIANYLSGMMTGASQAWAYLQTLYAKGIATALTYTMTGGLYHLEDNQYFVSALVTTMQAVMTVYGIPPTLPTGPELLDLSVEYVAKLAADEMAGGEVYEALKKAYQDLPADVRTKMEEGGEEIAREAVKGQTKSVFDALAPGTCQDIVLPGIGPEKRTVRWCSPRIPDPIYNSIRPATVMILVDNPNNEPTDMVMAEVRDSENLFVPGQAVVPSLQPGESLSIPVVLQENLLPFLDINGGKCPTRDAWTTAGAVPCDVQAWRDKLQRQGAYYQNPKQPVTFKVTFARGTGPAMISGLDASSNNRPVQGLLAVDIGQSCPTSRLVRYPAGWRMAPAERTILPDAWDEFYWGGNTSQACKSANSFSSLKCGTADSGFLRNR